VGVGRPPTPKQAAWLKRCWDKAEEEGFVVGESLAVIPEEMG